jgi:hypothetical protein
VFFDVVGPLRRLGLPTPAWAKLIHDGLLALNGLPAASSEGIKGGTLLEQGLTGVILE